MATILFTASSSSYNCPQRVELTEEKVQPTVRRLSEQSERRQTEARRQSMASIEKASMNERLTSVRQGKLPTNQQINAAISKFLNSRVIQSQPKSEDGKLVLKDIQGLLIAIQRGLYLKNSDELFQSMMYHTKIAKDSEITDSEMSEFKLGTFAVMKIIKFLLFDSQFKDLLSNILFTVQVVLEEETGQPQASSSKSDPEPQVPRTDLILCLKNIFTTLRKHPEYRPPLETLLSLIILWTDRLTWRPDEPEAHHAAASEIKKMFSRWTDTIPLDPFLKRLNDLACSVRNDSQLSQFYSSARELSDRSLQEDAFDEQAWSKLITELKESHQFLKYQGTMMTLVDEAQMIIQSFKDDPISKEISEKLYSLHQHLWSNKTILRPHLLDDLKRTLLPAFIEQITYIPLPKLTIDDNEQYEIIIDNMALPGGTLMPKVDDSLRFCPDSDNESSSVQGLYIQLLGIQTLMEDVNFCYKRRAGFMGIKDTGIASVNINDLSLSVHLTSDSKDRAHRFQVEQCTCSINKLTVQVKESNHNNLYKIFNPVLTGMVKRQITKEIENNVIQLFNKGDAKLTKHLGGRRNSQKKRRTSFISQIAQSVNQKSVGIQ